jgi:hypothetical protein
MDKTNFVQFASFAPFYFLHHNFMMNEKVKLYICMSNNTFFIPSISNVNQKKKRVGRFTRRVTQYDNEIIKFNNQWYLPTQIAEIL